MSTYSPSQTLPETLDLVPSRTSQHPRVVTKPVKVLQNIYTKRVSGDLTVKSMEEASLAWRLYFGQGELHYASSLLGGRERLRYVLHHHLPSLLPLVPESLPQSEYQWLYDLWQNHILSFNDLRSLLYHLTQDAFVQILSLSNVSLQFARTMSLSTILLSVNIKDLLQASTPSIKGFQGVQDTMQSKSPLQRFKLVNRSTLTDTDTEALRQLDRDLGFSQEMLSQGLTLYDLAVAFNVQTLPLVQILAPLLKTGSAELLPYQTLPEARSPLIACIDDSATVQRTVKLILESVGYRVNTITQPLMALSSLGREIPDVILLDINMPDMDGYTLCRILRQCTLFKSVPIVMLTGRDAILDQVRARLLGASSYITKPFQPQTLTDMISRYASVEVKP